MNEQLSQEIEQMIGQPQYAMDADIVVERGYIRSFVAATENANPLYWNAEQSKVVTGGELAPVSMLSAWCRPEQWQADAAQSVKALQLHYDLKAALGFPTAIVVAIESTFYEPVFVGDRLKSRQVLQSISEPKDTRLGRGRFWVVEMQYFNQRDEAVGIDRFECLGYIKGGSK